MFAYCYNNPIAFEDSRGSDAAAALLWMGSSGAACVADGPLPIVDILVITIGIVILFCPPVSFNYYTPSTREEVPNNIYEAAEHKKGARPSTEEKHEKGQTRKKKDHRGEKGDERRYYLGNKRKVYEILVAGGLIDADEALWFGDEYVSDYSNG